MIITQMPKGYLARYGFFYASLPPWKIVNRVDGYEVI